MKTPTIVGLVALLVGLVAAVTTLIVTGHDPAPLVNQLPILAAVVASLFGIDKITKNTNGTLSDLRAKNESLTAENAALRSVATPAQIQQVAPVVPVAPTNPAPPISDPIPALPEAATPPAPATVPAPTSVSGTTNENV